MDDTMTLECVRDLLASYGNAFMDAVHAVSAALRERDELRKIERIARCEMIPDVVSWRERAEKAEAELVELKRALWKRALWKRALW